MLALSFVLATATTAVAIAAQPSPPTIEDQNDRLLRHQRAEQAAREQAAVERARSWSAASSRPVPSTARGRPAGHTGRHGHAQPWRGPARHLAGWPGRGVGWWCCGHGRLDGGHSPAGASGGFCCLTHRSTLSSIDVLGGGAWVPAARPVHGSGRAAVDGAPRVVRLPGRFEHFYLEEYPKVVALVYVLSGSRAGAEDIAQEAFLRAYRDWDRVGSYEHQAAWVRRVAANLATTGLRRRLVEVRALTRLAGRREPAVDPLAAQDGEFWAAVRALPRRQARRWRCTTFRICRSSRPQRHWAAPRGRSRRISPRPDGRWPGSCRQRRGGIDEP